MINSRRRSVTLEWAGTWNTLDQAVRTLGRPRGRADHCSQAVRLRKSTPAMQCTAVVASRTNRPRRSTATELPSESVVKMDGARAKTSQGSSAAARALLCAPSLHEELTSLCGGGSFMTSSDGSHFRSNGNIPVFCSKSWAKVHTNCPACAGFLLALV